MTDNSKYSILIVCTGNTCRSAMAEGILKKTASDNNIDNLHICSAGTAAINGAPATDFAVVAAGHWGVDISNHKSQSLTKELIKNSDLILTMGSEHVERILAVDKSMLSKMYLFKGFPEPYNMDQERVDDPIGGSLEQYNQTFLELSEVVRKVFPQIVELSKANG